MSINKNDAAREIAKGAGSLIMLAEWQLSLAKDIRKRAEGLLAEGETPLADDPLIGKPD